MTPYSPGLSVATALFELCVAGWSLRGPGRPEIVRPTAAILTFLAGYQLLEVLVCGAPSATFLARLAFADVVWLPPFGVWLVLQLGAPDDAWLRKAAGSMFGVAGLLTAWVLMDEAFVRHTICQAVVATFRTPGSVYSAYGAFYQLGLFAMVGGAAIGMAHSDSAVARQHLADVQLGTLGFMLPSMLTLIMVPSVLGSMPSVMCHYAIVLAVFLARLVARERRLVQGTLAAA